LANQGHGNPITVVPVVDINSKAILWYKRLGYSNPQRIVQAVHDNIISGINLPKSIK
jgi:hypothetical protein